MLEDILYRISKIVLAVCGAIYHSILAFIYGGRGKIVPTIKNPLLLKSASKLAQEIREGKLRCEDVIEAYIDRIVEIEPFINATAECCFQDAMTRARKVDALIASRKHTQEQLATEKPLLGVPFTVKVLIHVKGMPCTGASKLFEDQLATDDSAAVALMRDAGAILIATTNSAEMAMYIETTNKTYGRTCNPYDTNRTPGGSSGGESALIAAGGSLIGLGNDFIGSIRIPANFTGIFGHKPTRGLVPNKGTFPPEFPNEPLQPKYQNLNKYFTTGPLCRYAEDLLTSMKILSSKSELKVDLNQKVDFKRLKICYLTNIRSPFVADVDKEIIAALKNAVTFFEIKCNTEAKEIKMQSLYDINRCIFTMILPYVNDLKYDIASMKGINDISEFLKICFGISKISLPTAVMLKLASCRLLCNEKKSAHYAEMIKGLIKQFNNMLDEDTVLLMPTTPYMAPYHGGTLPFLLSLSFTGLFNLLGQPSTHCPIGFNEQNLPYGIQIVGCHGNDALTIACAVELEKEFGGWKPPAEM